MIVIGNAPSWFFSSQGDRSDPGALSAPSNDVPGYSMDDLFADPEVCRRVGSIIAKGAQRRRPVSRPAPRRGRPGGSTD